MDCAACAVARSIPRGSSDELEQPTTATSDPPAIRASAVGMAIWVAAFVPLAAL
jgi:hypothetical protein